MKAFCVCVILLVGTVGALAQSAIVPPPKPPQAFVPLVVTTDDYRQFVAWLNEQPAKFAIPVLNWLDQMEQKSIADAKAKTDTKETPKTELKKP